MSGPFVQKPIGARQNIDPLPRGKVVAFYGVSDIVARRDPCCRGFRCFNIRGQILGRWRAAVRLIGSYLAKLIDLTALTVRAAGWPRKNGFIRTTKPADWFSRYRRGYLEILLKVPAMCYVVGTSALLPAAEILRTNVEHIKDVKGGATPWISQENLAVGTQAHDVSGHEIGVGGSRLFYHVKVSPRWFQCATEGRRVEWVTAVVPGPA